MWEDLGKQGWLTEDAHSVNTLVSIVRLKINFLELSKLIFAGFLFCFVSFILFLLQNKLSIKLKNKLKIITLLKNSVNKNTSENKHILGVGVSNFLKRICLYLNLKKSPLCANDKYIRFFTIWNKDLSFTCTQVYSCVPCSYGCHWGHYENREESMQAASEIMLHAHKIWKLIFFFSFTVLCLSPLRIFIKLSREAIAFSWSLC